MTQDSEAKSKQIDKRRPKDLPPTKALCSSCLFALISLLRHNKQVVVRRLPPSLTAETLLEQISPLPSYDFFYFMKADLSLGTNAFTRAYFNFLDYEDIANFRDKFDGYVFIDGKGNEYPAIVEFSAFQKVPKKKPKKPDSKKGTIEQDSDYQKFLDSLNNPEDENVVSIESYLEELEAKERDAKATKGGPRITTPLIEYIKKRREEKRNSVIRAREERKKRDQERKQFREEERRKRRERDERERDKDWHKLKEKDRHRSTEKEKLDDRDRGVPVKLLKNTEREIETDENQTERDRSSERKKERENSDKDSLKVREDKTKLRFSKENREKIKEQREVKDRRDFKSRGRSSPAKSDYQRSARDEPRDKDDRRSERDDRKYDRDDRRSDERRYDHDDKKSDRYPKSYREDRPRSGPSRRDDRKYRDDYRDGGRHINTNNSHESSKSGRPPVISKSDRPSSSKYDGSKEIRKPDRDSEMKKLERDSEIRKSDRDSVKSESSDMSVKSTKPEKDMVKPNIDDIKGGDSTKDAKEDDIKVGDSTKNAKVDDVKAAGDLGKDIGKSERDRTKTSRELSPSDSAKDIGRDSLDQSMADDEKRRKRKERPERAIYDPRKAAERRQGAGAKKDVLKDEQNQKTFDK